MPEPVRNRVGNHLDHTAGQAAIAGKQAARIAGRRPHARPATVFGRIGGGARLRQPTAARRAGSSHAGGRAATALGSAPARTARRRNLRFPFWDAASDES
ncbi:hypothetical protein [Nocardia xishanensis]